MNRTTKKISIIVPVYRGQQYIYNIIKMLEKNWIILYKICDLEMELILVNDYPYEKLYIEDKWLKNIKVRLLEMDINQGIHGARIAGLKEASGDYLLFLDQDDEISDNYFLSQLKCIGDAGAVLCNGIYRNSKMIYLNEEEQRRAVDKEEYLRSLQWSNLIVSPGQVLLRKEAIPYTWYQYNLKENGIDDVLLWIMMFNNKEIFSINFELLYVHKENGNNASLDFYNMFNSATELLSFVNEHNLLNKTDLLLFEIGINRKMDKYQRYIKILSEMDVIAKNTKKYIEDHSYKEIAIYGMGVVGEKYISELYKYGINIAYGIDKKSNSFLDKKIKIVNLENRLDSVDLIIVTATFEYETIKKEIKNKVIYPVISMESFL